MDVSNPIRSVIPAVQGDVLAVLARTDVPLTGRGISRLIPEVSDSGVKKALRALNDAGLVLVDLVEPEWPARNDQVWGGWSPTRGALFPGTAIFVTVRG